MQEGFTGTDLKPRHKPPKGKTSSPQGIYYARVMQDYKFIQGRPSVSDIPHNSLVVS
jgi:hypothetical protein